MTDTLAVKFKDLALRIVPEQEDLQDLDSNINSYSEIDDIMFRKGEYLGGMASVILNLLEHKGIT